MYYEGSKGSCHIGWTESNLFASRASHNGWNGLIFGKSATFMHFDPHKKFQSDQITHSSSKWWLSLKVIKWSFDNDRVIWINWNFLWRSKCINVALLPNISPFHPLWEALEAKRSDRAPKIWLSSRYVTAPFCRIYPHPFLVAFMELNMRCGG